LIIWPETARPRPLYHWLDRPRTYAMPDVQYLASELGIPFLVGVEYVRVRSREDYDLFNAAMVVDADGVDPAWYGKVYLVAFSEALPFRGLFGPLIEGRGGQWRWVSGGFSPGVRDELLQVDGMPVGVLVCYEQMFADLTRGMRNAGARLQVVITNDAWFGRTLFQRYQADAVRLRAIESRTDFVRAANTGISGFVDRRGRFHDDTPLFEEAVRVRDVELGSQRTVYDRIGDAIMWPVLLGLFGAILIARQRGAGSPARPSLRESDGGGAQ
jgi:apolipoprotein N-acyltransferase